MSGKRVLVIDDNEGALKLMKRNLDTLDMEAMLANNADKGLKLAKSRHPDAILLDIMMPGMPGDELAMILRDDPDTCDIPIIFSTALACEVDMEANSHGGHKYLSKDLSEDDLRKKLKEFLL